MRVVLFTGKGGVGKTTSAAATAVAAARAGHRTLVLSTDPAHSLADALGVPLGPAPRAVAPGLDAVEVDAQRRFERSWERLRDYLAAAVRRGGLDGVTAEEVVVPPGVDELLALLAVRDAAVAGTHDVVVVDCAPTAETLRLLALPGTVRWYLDRLRPLQQRVGRVVRPLLGGDVAGWLPDEAVLDAVADLQAQLAAVQTLLTDPAVSSVRLVLTPETMALAEARRTYTTLALHGLVVDGVVVNRVMPAGDDPWRAGWAAAHAAHLETARQSFGAAVRPVPYLPAEPIGLPALTALGAALYGDGDPVAPAGREAPLSLSTDGDDHLLSLALPLADRADVGLVRAGDDLVVTVAGHRRVLALPGALRRAAVGGAQLRDGRLTVRFQPAPRRQPSEVGS